MIPIQENIDLLPYNTFQVSCIAKYFVIVKSVQDLQALIQTQTWQDQEKRLFLGGGSNMLFVSPTYDGIVVKNEIMGKEIEKKEEGRNEKEERLSDTGTGTQLLASTTLSQYQSNSGSIIKVGAGENRDEFVSRSIQQGYHGIENLISIPGTVGAAPVQNIGAYGVEVESLIYEVEGVDMQTGELYVFSHDACGFGYRDSVFKNTLRGKICITTVTLRLSQYSSESYTPLLRYGVVQERVQQIQQGEHTTPGDVATAIAQIRAEKLPDWKKLGTAGSFFKNPYVSEEVFIRLEKEFGIKGWKVKVANSEELVANKDEDSVSYSPSAISSQYKLSAGQLIDMAGMKGYRLGDIGVSLDHALVLVNYSERDGSKFLELIGLIQDKVEKMFGVRLEAEVNLL